MTCWLYDTCSHVDCEKGFCLKKYKLEQLYEASLLSEKQRKHLALYPDADGTDIDVFKKLAGISKDIVRFVDEGGNLFLYSDNCGCGKTSWAIRMIQTYFNQIWVRSDLTCRALFVHVPSFLNALKASISAPNEYADYILQNIETADIIVWDDIADKIGSEYDLNKLLSFIDRRIALGKTNIYTSNIHGRKLVEALGERLASRIERFSISLEFKGGDKRSYAVKGVN